jgi:hypothetical protein
MKFKPIFCHVALFTSIALFPSLKALEVHEWGTFTVLVSSRGQTVNWYQPYTDAARLPDFVQANNLMTRKSRIPSARVRMETPERFPATTDQPYTLVPSGLLTSTLTNPVLSLSCVAVRQTSEMVFDQRMSEYSAKTPPSIARWTGKLLPPDHEDAKLIPAVAKQQGDNYAAARNVPDAWIFHSDVPNNITPSIQPVEKFIFYRGAGQSLPPYAVSMPDDHSMSFSSQSQSASTFQIALRVKDGKASWVQMPNVSGPAQGAARSANVAFPEKTVSLEEADHELRALFLTALTEQGLTKAEAQAMIDTWNHTWFSEPGQRVFTIVDRAWVDSVLPLAITPEPQKIERVFVARYEVLSAAAEQQLADVMTKQVSGKQAAAKIADLQLGRFSNGAAEIVADNIKQSSLNQFRLLQYQEQAQANAGK